MNGKRRDSWWKCLGASSALFAYFVLVPGGWTGPQYLPGPTPAATLRNAVAATDTQAGMVIKAAYDWGRRGNSPNYDAAQFLQDFENVRTQFLFLRQTFTALGNLALQLGRPRADNAVAELDAGLETIAELFTFLQSQYSSGTLDNRTLVRTCRAFEDAMKLWQRELKKNSARLGVAG